MTNRSTVDKNNNLTNCFDKFAGDDIYVVSRNGVKLTVISFVNQLMNISKTASSGIFKIVEKIIRGHPLIYYILRYLFDLTNIFEEDAKGVKFLNFKNKINIIDVGASDAIATKFFCKNLNVNKVFCYEPNISYVKILRKLDLANVKIYPYGISNKKSKHQVFLPRYSFFKNNFDLVTYTFYNKKDLIKQIKFDFKFTKNISIIKKI